jgi:hypothetical protein
LPEGAAKLLGVAGRVASYAGNDPELNALVAELRASADEFGRPMEEMYRKQSHTAAHFGNRSKTVRGRSTRDDDV